MLIIYRKSDGKIASNSGRNSQFPLGPAFEFEVENAIRFMESGVPDDYEEYRLSDEDDEELVGQILNSDSYNLTFDGDGKPTGVENIVARIPEVPTPSLDDVILKEALGDVVKLSDPETLRALIRKSGID